MTPSSRKPACAIEEYASIRFMSVWVMPRIAPIIMDSAAITPSTGRQDHTIGRQ